jgi:hypothetical protein
MEARMFKRVFVLTFPLLVLLATATTAVGLERQRTPDWQSELDRYFAVNEDVAAAYHIESVALAGEPWNFHEGMGTTWRDPEKILWLIDQLPYPPESLYCILLAPNASSGLEGKIEPARRVFYVGRHSDKMWRDGWLVHEGPSEVDSDFATDLASLGCDLTR